MTKLYLGPKYPIRIAIIKGPPVNPNRKLSEIPGSENGILARIQPKTIPRKMGIRLGTLRRRIELPRTFSVWDIANSEPTTVTLSPICNFN